MKYHYNADNHTLACVIAPVNGFSSANFIDIAKCVDVTSYSSLQDGPGAFYCYSAGVIGISHCIMAVSCICTLLGAIFSIKTDKKSKKSSN